MGEERRQEHRDERREERRGTIDKRDERRGAERRALREEKKKYEKLTLQIVATQAMQIQIAKAHAKESKAKAQLEQSDDEHGQAVVSRSSEGSMQPSQPTAGFTQDDSGNVTSVNT